jgi:hypothetical protein
VRVIVIDAGKVNTGDEFSADIRVKDVKDIASLFAGTDELDLKVTDRTIAFIAGDALFDNYKLELRLLGAEKGSDSVTIAQRIATIGEDDLTAPGAVVCVSSDTSVRVAAAGKALGTGSTARQILGNSVLGARIQFGSSAVAFVRATEAQIAREGKWDVALAIDIPAEWFGDRVTLQHLLDGALPGPSIAAVADPVEPEVDPSTVTSDSDDVDSGAVPEVDDTATPAEVSNGATAEDAA